MPSASTIAYYLLHPQELRAMVQWGTWHNPVHERNPENEAPSLRRCFELLDLTSRSFSTVIKELTPELLVPVCCFYLILRGLDTIEDDMSIPAKVKEPLLKDFYKIVEEDGWSFDGCGPDMKDRELLVQFHYVVEEFKKVKPEYREIIKNITKRMGDGMAITAVKAEENDGISVESVEDYTEYCHYVAGLVGEGLTRLFVESGLANPVLLKRPDLHESMGQFLQQTNIVRDIREDFEDKRLFWPKAVWSKYVDNFEDLFKKENEEAALRCSSEMVLIALERATDCMFYMAGIKEQSVFNFVAIPQSMAIATLELCFRNPAIFHRNVKITKGQACQLMLDSSQNLQIVYEPFKKFARKIHKKNDPRDPNFLKISIACGKIEQFIEFIFPSQDSKAVVRAAGGGSTTAHAETPEQVAKRKEEEADSRKTVMYLSLATLSAVALMSIVMFSVAWLMGARFDLAWQGVPRSDLPGYREQWPRTTGVEDLARLAEEKAHAEL